MLFDATALGLQGGKGLVALDDADLARLSIGGAHAAFGYLDRAGLTTKSGLFTRLSWRTPGPQFHAPIADGEIRRPMWSRPYDEIADGKGVIVGRTGLDSGVVVREHPELLLDTDKYKYRGAVLKQVKYSVAGVSFEAEAIATTSGVQSEIDEEISRFAGRLFAMLHMLRAMERAAIHG